MVGDLSALELLKEHRYCIDSLIRRMEAGETFIPTVLSIHMLLNARDCLAAARTEERYINELKLPDQDLS